MCMCNNRTSKYWFMTLAHCKGREKGRREELRVCGCSRQMDKLRRYTDSLVNCPCYKHHTLTPLDLIEGGGWDYFCMAVFPLRRVPIQGKGVYFCVDEAGGSSGAFTSGKGLFLSGGGRCGGGVSFK